MFSWIIGKTDPILNYINQNKENIEQCNINKLHYNSLIENIDKDVRISSYSDRYPIVKYLIKFYDKIDYNTQIIDKKVELDENRYLIFDKNIFL